MSQADRQHRLGIILIVAAAIAWNIMEDSRARSAAVLGNDASHEGQASCHVPCCRMRRNVIRPIQQGLVAFDMMASKLIELARVACVQ